MNRYDARQPDAIKHLSNIWIDQQEHNYLNYINRNQSEPLKQRGITNKSSIKDADSGLKSQSFMTLAPTEMVRHPSPAERQKSLTFSLCLLTSGLRLSQHSVMCSSLQLLIKSKNMVVRSLYQTPCWI